VIIAIPAQKSSLQGIPSKVSPCKPETITELYFMRRFTKILAALVVVVRRTVEEVT
jgi:hypothetical protein